jgi:putative oxidoreductase
MFMQRFENQLYALLRIIVGFLFMWHGAQKLFNFPPLPPGIILPWHLLHIAGPIEFFGGSLIMLGLFTHWAAFIAAGEMAVAYWTGHAHNAVLPLVNKGELAVLYCFIYLFFSARGSGIWSLDQLLFRNKKTDTREAHLH